MGDELWGGAFGSGKALTQDARAWILFLVSHFLVVQSGTFPLGLFSDL